MSKKKQKEQLPSGPTEKEIEEKLKKVEEGQ
jgi:hypothetical protein